MTRTPEDPIAAFEAEQAEIDAKLREMGFDLDADPTSVLVDYPAILRATCENRGSALVADLKRLIADGADIDATSPFGETAAGQCFRAGEWEALRLLLAQGARADDLSLSKAERDIIVGGTPALPDPMLRDAVGRTPFLFACRVGNVTAARTWRHLTPEDGQFTEPDREGPLLMATRSGVPAMLDWALAEGFDVNARARFGRTALLEAIERDDVAAAERLLEAGADPQLAENISAAMKGHDADAPKSVFAKAAEFLMSKTPLPYELSDTFQSPASAARSPEMVRLLVRHGVNLTEFDADAMPAALGTDRIAPVTVSRGSFAEHRTARAGRTNPEPFLPDFWREQIRTMRSGYAAEIEILGEREIVCGAPPVWSFDRFGRSATALPDGRIVLVGGEHEDHYDSDFRIYADVTVLGSGGEVAHYVYPDDLFPPTDFHTATLLDDHILLIGSLGYPEQRLEGVTQVLRLNLADFSIQPVATAGENPGWIHGHCAQLTEGRILVSGGRIEPGHRENTDAFVLDLTSLSWTRVSGRH